ncbi:MAG: hypothetical protein BYD32DRAFT_415710 [Podila humilis]|nr:MAG: hypothetical protein BYD32DRAFT_415710 [Podila humilis]
MCPYPLSLANCPVSCFPKQQKTAFSEGRWSLLFGVSHINIHALSHLLVCSFIFIQQKTLFDRYIYFFTILLGIQLCWLLFLVWKGRDTDGSGGTWAWMDGWMDGCVGGYKNTHTS